MRGSVSGQTDSSPIPTITLTRYQSVSTHVGQSALWASVAPQRPLIPLNKPSTYCPFCFHNLYPPTVCVPAAVALSVHRVLL